ncbi:DUF3311 domain-containing protein [Streptomyces sp. TM32]|nr:DUF3311 domain-containing protein [Streptomyces sp. TM32]
MTRTGRHRLRHVAAAVLLLAPVAGPLSVPWYAGASPRFFSRYRLARVPGPGCCLSVAYG